MPYCPDCGRHVAPGDATCAECGQSISEALAAGRGGAEDTRRSPPRESQTARGAPPATAATEEDPQTRRRVLAAAGGVLGTMVLGTYAVNRVTGNGPADAVDAWRTAWVSGDAEAFQRLWHPAGTRPDDAVGRPSDVDASLEFIGEERAVLERTETTALVRDVFVLGHPEFETRRRHETVVELRTHETDWRIFEERLEHTEPTSCRRTITITGPGRLVCE